jgi:integrase
LGSEALELTYKDPAGKVAKQLLYRHDEPRLEVVVPGRPWSFDGDGHLFWPVSEAHRIRRVAAQANAHLPEDEKIDVSPHVLRHTFLRKLAETKGVHYAREASGHQSDRYIWRYVKPDQQTLAEAIAEARRHELCP